MQTFLPFKSFTQSAQVLDNKRLGKQRVEVVQILNTLFGKSNGWINHPAVKMWRGYEYGLCTYGYVICHEWRVRSFKDTCSEKIFELEKNVDWSNPAWNTSLYPPWLTNEFCQSHQSNLVRKNPEHYRKYFPDVPDNLPYIWPVNPSIEESTK